MSRLVLPDSELGRLFAETDWENTALGPVDTWPAELVSAVNTALAQRFAMLVCWGPDLLMLYNDAYRVLLGEEKHPGALGLPVKDVWPEVWELIEPRFTDVVTSGEASWDEDQLLVVDRRGFLEEAYFTWSYSVIRGADGSVAGVLDVATETTGKVLSERRADVVSRLAAELPLAESADDVERIALDVMRGNTADHPSVDLVREAPPVALQAVGASTGPRTHTVAVAESPRSRPSGYLVLTENLRRPWDASLQRYVELCARYVAAALAGVRRLDDERQRAASLAELDEAKNAFFANISHELRTPLTLIAGPVHDLVTSGELPSGVHHQLELVERNTERLRLLVERLLDLTRMDAGRVHPQRVSTDVAEQVRGFAASFRPAFGRLGLSFGTDVPDLSRPAWVDPDMLERIVLNLLSNALKYTPQGGVQVALHEVDDGFEVLVTDSGVGIKPEDLDAVFDRFRRLDLDERVRSREGAGIGLFLVRQLAELHGGRVWVDSVHGIGSTFGVHLPWGEPPTEDDVLRGGSISRRTVESFVAEVDAWDPIPGSEDHAPAPLRLVTPGSLADTIEDPAPRPVLLLAEDNRDMRTYLADSLVDAYDVVVTRDGAEALEEARRSRPDIVLADVMMPRLDGLGLLRELRGDERLATVPVVLLTARADAEASLRGLLRGADDYVAKPFEMRHLRGRLAANLARARERAREAAWQRAVLASLHEPLSIFEPGGRVVSLNEAFTRAFGWSLEEDGPIELPYPWNVEGPTAAADRVDRILSADGPVRETFPIARRDGSRAWVSITSSVIPADDLHQALVVNVVRDTTLEHEAEQRRERAAVLAAELRSATELEQVLASAVAGFSVLYDGIATVQVPDGTSKGRLSFTPKGPTPEAELHPLTREALTTGKAPGGRDARGDIAPGIVFSPDVAETPCRVWVRFRAPRRVTADERIAGDLIAQLFGEAVHRVASVHDREAKEAQLRQAIESHRIIGHAVGVLIERHRITAAEGFEMLRQSSLNRNIKLREIAQRVVETGLDPTEA